MEMSNKNYTSEINKTMLNEIFVGTYHFHSNARAFDPTKKYKAGDVFFYNEKIYCIHEDFFWDNKRYSKSYHRQFGGIKTVEKREIIIVGMGTLEIENRIEIDSFRGDFLRKHLGYLPKKELASKEISEKMRKEKEKLEKPICLGLAKRLGYCKDGISRFCQLFDFELKRRYSVGEFLSRIYRNWELRRDGRTYDYLPYIVEIIEKADPSFATDKLVREWDNGY